MQILTVVPFLIGVTSVLDVLADEPHLESSYEYNYQVNMTSNFQYYGYSGWIRSSNDTHLSLNILCSDVQLKSMICYIERCNEMEPAPLRILESGQLLYDINHYILCNNRVPFKIMIGTARINTYIVDRHSIPKELINIYRSITNQLIIGVNINMMNDMMNETFMMNERSNIAICPTSYAVSVFSVEPSTANLNIVPIPLVNLDLRKGTMIIEKQLIISECIAVSNYSFSAGLWPEFVPKTTNTTALINSNSWMRLSTHGMWSETINTFCFHDQYNLEIGHVRERVNVELKSYRNISTVHIPVINERNIIEYDTLNDDVRFEPISATNI
ncbi:uncharacterized protein LOC105181151 [Harpegnathos saltator]|uniref:uncharacterized protein LOC105181151 n=1 Tax=Harpegnathos saltator TaxID=610380 RepID=UPI00058E0933|nr:uncharacterized protein LOC105181151 [Harpegnathos saltator]XP_011136040.1 uncharacterized protein LOC105181151 [Harpegnathos saltator]